MAAKHAITQPPERRRGRLLIALVAALVAVSTVNGASALFTQSVQTAGPTVSTGRVIYLFGAGQPNRLNVAATQIAAGDTIQRAFQLVNNSTIRGVPSLASVTFSVTPTVSSPLDSDVVNGLLETVQACSVRWTETGPAPAYTYTCAGVRTYVVGSALAAVPVGTLETTPAVVNAGLRSLRTGGRDFLLLTLSLPVAAPGDLAKVPVACSGVPGGTSATENLEGCTSILRYVFTATQRPGIAE